jgi:transposase
MESPILTPEVMAALPEEVAAFIRWLVDENTRLRSQVAQLQADVAKLQNENAELRARLNQNSSNSSKPPSSDPPSKKPAPKKAPSGKRSGGQPGHPKHARPTRKPTKVVDQIPDTCHHCGTLLMGYDPNPTCRQVVELPVIQPEVTEYRLHRLTCLCCGTATSAVTPPAAQLEYGPRLQAAIALFSGEFRLSKRMTEALCEGVLGIEISTGQICDLERQTSEILQPVVKQAQDYVQERPANVDETGWRQEKKKAWLWVAATRFVVVFAIHLARSRAAFRNLMGEHPTEVVTSDRYSAYSHLPPERRQLCWSHLRRDFQAMIDRNDAGKPIGEDLLRLADKMLGQWKRVRDGTLSRAEFSDQFLPGLRTEVEATLERGSACGCAKTLTVCMELLRWRQSLWTFARVPDVEPTNNAAERTVRHAVCWRKTSYGTASEAGSRFVERILTVVASCRLQARKPLDFLTQCIQAARNGSPRPSLIPTAGP